MSDMLEHRPDQESHLAEFILRGEVYHTDGTV